MVNLFSKSKIFLILCLSFIAGVLVAPVLSKLIVAALAIVFVMSVSIGWANKYSRLVGFAGLILLLGVVRFQTEIARNNLSGYYNKTAQVTGVISEEPDVRDDKIYLTLDKITINDKSVDDKILVSVYTSRNFAYGEQIQFTGKILEPIEFPDFNYKGYLSRFGIDAVVYYPNADIIASNKGNVIKAALLKVKESFIANLGKVLPEPQNAFLAGLLVGNKRSIPQNFIDDFNATGTSHIIAISGYNITIIVWALDWALERFGRKVSFVANLSVILAFIVLTGASASVIRAGIMAGLVLISKNIGRLYHPTNALVGSAAVMIALNPKLPMFDVGFQLSFLALAGLVYLSPLMEKPAQKIPNIIREVLVATLAAQIFTLPILLYNFDQLSLVAPLTNILALPLVSITMLFGFLTGLAGFVWAQLAALLAWPAWILLSYILEVVQLTAHIPHASLSVHINLLGMIIYYFVLILGLGVWGFTKRKNFGNI